MAFIFQKQFLLFYCDVIQGEKSPIEDNNRANVTLTTLSHMMNSRVKFIFIDDLV